MLKKIAVGLLLAAAFAGSGLAQVLTHSVTLNWLDLNNPTGTTYNVYRAVGLCGGTPTFAKLASGVTAKTYNDSAVAPGNYCYQVTASVASIEGPPSNTINPQVQPFVVTLTFTQQ